MKKTKPQPQPSTNEPRGQVGQRVRVHYGVGAPCWNAMGTIRARELKTLSSPWKDRPEFSSQEWYYKLDYDEPYLQQRFGELNEWPQHCLIFLEVPEEVTE